jgi:penicillin G amidase
MRRRERAAAGWALLPMLAPLLSACAALAPGRVTTAERLAAFPTQALPLERPVTVRWNRFGVPWIEAQTDRDLAFTLGLVHAHLRLGQMALAKRIVQGRLSESAGPFTRDIDRLLRTIDFGHAAAASEAMMSPATHAWMQAFVDGLNWYQQHATRRPPEYALLGLKDEPWMMRDLLAIGRLAGADVNWLIDARLLKARLQPGWPQQWQRALAAGADSTVSFSGSKEQALLFDVLAGSSRSGSDAIAVAPVHSASGAALLAADPHLGMTLPNFWLLIGLKSPTYHVVGLMPPGLPIVGLGRNEDIAWSGTNMHAAASELYDISGAGADGITARRERLRTRLWRDSEVTIRRAALGPIVSDLPFFPGRPGETLALHWIGYEASDEIGAFLGVMRSNSAEQFRQALAGYSVGGQNMLCVTRTGDICQVMAVHLPIRDPAPPGDLVRRATDPAAWHGQADALALPWALNPPGGLLASANNRPTEMPFPVGYFFPTSERVERLYQLLRAKDKLSIEDLSALQRDTLSGSALGLKAALVGLILESRPPATASTFLAALQSWDGRYEAEQPGAVAFELLLYEIAQRLYTSADESVRAAASDWNYLVHYLPQDLAAQPGPVRKALIDAAIEAAAGASARYRTWGDVHRLRIGHALAGAPVIGRFFVLDEYGVGGSRNTIMKSAHGLVSGRHYVTFGSQSRQLCDMADPDRNEFVLLGGEDGWLGSANFADQVELWRQGRTITLPLSAAAVTAQFPTALVLTPRSKP